MTLLDEIVADIGHGVYTGLTQPTAQPIAHQGPHRWHEMKGSDFGPTWDFETEDHGPLVVFDPLSEAALQWCYAHLPQDMPRFGARGFLIEAEHIKSIVGGARRDGLMNETDFIQAMEEANQIARQWDDQDG